jgi:hypothetical protein
VSVISITIVFAQTYNAKCIVAKLGSQETSSCVFDLQGNCTGSYFMRFVAVNGYCDTTETGTCQNATENIWVPVNFTGDCGIHGSRLSRLNVLI